MAPSTAPVPIYTAAAAGRLADLFNSLSQALDDFRLEDHVPPISADQSARLKDEAQALEDRAHFLRSFDDIQGNVGIDSINIWRT